MRWVLVLAALVFAGSCAHGHCYEVEPFCFGGETYCEYSRDGSCKVCACVDSAELRSADSRR